MLISDPLLRRQRAQAKRQAVLAFLADEVWTSSAIIGRVTGLDARQAVYRLLAAMERTGEIRRASAPVLEGQGVTIWGITPHGLALTPNADPAGRYFEASKLSLERVPHQLALQNIRLDAEAAGWTEWARGETLGKNPPIRPDAVARRPDGNIVAVECERTIKTAKRYQKVVSEHLRAMRAGKWAGVYFVCPPPVALGLQRMFDHIEYLPGGIPWDEAGRRRFRILSATDFPPNRSVIVTPMETDPCSLPVT